MRRTNDGQTLIEVMVTVLFMAIAVIALIRFQNYLAYDSMLTRQKNDATLLANQRLELLRDFQVLNNTSGYTSYQSIITGTTTATIGNTTYTLNWTVTPFTNPTYKNVNVVVSWTDRNNLSQSVQMSSDIAGVDPTTSGSVM